MTKRPDRMLSHLGDEALIKVMDDELAPSEMAEAELHLSQCTECKQRYEALWLVSDQVELFASAVPLRSVPNGRDRLACQIDNRQANESLPALDKRLHRLSWGLAIAATIALAVLVPVHRIEKSSEDSKVKSSGRIAETFELNGEIFSPLPYSNPDLPVSTSHIVRMQVPVSSLADAGFSLEPAAAQQTAFDHSVLADVLIGMDGQPRGLHVLSSD